MASLGLLGALGGAGQALDTMSKTGTKNVLQQRREQRLENARKRAEERQRSFKKEMVADEREYQGERFDVEREAGREDTLWGLQVKSAMEGPQPPETRTIERGDTKVTEEWVNGEWRPIAEASRWQTKDDGMSAKETEIMQLMRDRDLGYSEAADLVYGRVKTIQHPVTGQTVEYNAATGETRPIEFGGEGMELLPEPDAGGGIVGGDDPVEVGFIPWAAETASRFGGQFSDSANNPELNRARAELRLLQEEIINAYAKSGRPPVVEQERILQNMPSLGWFESPSRAKDILSTMRDDLIRVRNDDIRFSENELAPADKRGDAIERARSIDRVLRRLDPTIFGDRGNREGQADAGPTERREVQPSNAGQTTPPEQESPRPMGRQQSIPDIESAPISRLQDWVLNASDEDIENLPPSQQQRLERRLRSGE